MVRDMEEEKDMEERQKEKQGKDSKESAIRVGRWDTHQENVPRAKAKEEKEIGEAKARTKEKAKEDFQEIAMHVESGAIRPSIAQKARAKGGLKEG